MEAAWLSLAKNLPTGQKTRADCPECGEGTNTNAAIVNHNGKGYSLYCNACGHNPFVGKGKQTLAELTRLKELNDEAEQYNDATISLPKDYTTDIPLEGRLWLYQAGITESVWRTYGIGYSEHFRRVVLPVYDDNRNLLWYQLRALLPGQKPKYIQPSRDRSNILFKSRENTRSTDTIIIVEDIASAIRVGRHVPTASLLGTKITTAQANYLSQFGLVITWLDSDRPGRQGAYSIRKTMGLVTEVADIVTKVDPKKLSDYQIKQELARCIPASNT